VRKAAPSPEGSFGRVFANPEARGLLIAQAASEIGDQTARVAMALLVLAETGSTLASALALAVAYVPGILGAALLGSLADRFPRRTVMLVCDLGRAVLVGALALLVRGSAPLLVLFALLLASEFMSLPFGTARASLYPDVLPVRSDYVTAQGLSRSLYQSTQVFGAILGGGLVQLLGASTALALDAVTFGVSFLLIVRFVQVRPSADERGTSARRILADLRVGVGELWSDPARRVITLLGWSSAAFLIAPEAVAFAYRPELTPLIGGVLLAAVPAGVTIGGILMTRVPMRDQLRFLLPLAALSCLPLFATSINPQPIVAAALWFCAGVLQAFMLTVISAVTLLTPQERRGRVLGVAGAGFNAATAVSFAVVGWLAGQPSIGPAKAVSLSGAAGLIIVAGLRTVWPYDDIEAAA